ncbi:unnamed protein product [Sphagnum jensenii]|uniref:Endoglucanase n=2 Tax=Sphagnum jensenii TaxID=128206 RepID=A0ABP0VKU5_9BRYO
MEKGNVDENEKNMSALLVTSLLLLSFVLVFEVPGASAVVFDYGDALEKSFLFLEAQRSGTLPANQRVTWRSNSGLNDGRSAGVNLVGGYYDAGDNVKFGFPMAFTITMLSWSVIEYGSQMASQGQLGYSLEAIQWGTDYFIKAHPEPNVLYGEVGDGDSDHACWQRPEDMTTSRKAYALTPNDPGSDLAGETAAAMAAASIVFRSHGNPTYANELLNHAEQLFNFANTYRGRYDYSIPLAEKYYQSVSGYDDELLWAAMWLHEATGQESYLQYVAENAQQLGGTGWAMDQFGWDNKYAGVQLKAAKLLMTGNAGPYASTLQQYQAKAEYFLCSALQKNNGMQMPMTPGGMYWINPWNNMQYVSTAAFLLTVASDYYTAAGQQLSHCSSSVTNAQLFAAGKAQVDYILGNNNRGQSYLVGFGSNYPDQVHHRGASIVSIKVDSQFVSCLGGYADWYNRGSANPNLITGALVGGPDENDDFVDERNAYEMTEPTTYNTAPLVGVLARLQGGENPSSAVAATHQSKTSHQNLAANPVLARPQQQQAKALVKITQKLQVEWTVKGSTFYKYGGSVINESKDTVASLTIVIHRLYGPIYGLSPIHPNGNFYSFPAGIKSLAPGEKIDFVYIHHSDAAMIYVQKYALT